MKKSISLPLFVPGMTLFPDKPKENSTQFSRISTEILNNGKGYPELRVLTQIITRRLSGSGL